MVGRVLFGLLLLAIIVLIAGNLSSLWDGVRYVRHALAWRPRAIQSVNPQGPFGLCYALSCRTNAERHALIVREIEGLGLAYALIEVPGEPLPNVLVALGGRGPYTLFAAHYDKTPDDPACQAAADNTAAVVVLLAALRDLAPDSRVRPAAFLFTGAEETGLKGARAFVAWAAQHGFEVAEVINLDMLGRGKIAARPSALPGFYFWLPGMGELVYDGRGIARGEPYAQLDPALLARLRAVLGDELVVYRRFAAQSDSNVFQQAGWPTVCLSSDDMYYLNLVWGRETDCAELVDERHLELTRRFVTLCALDGNIGCAEGDKA